MIDAHHHLWDLSAVSYPWLEDKSRKRFFGDPTPIQKNYLIQDFKKIVSHMDLMLRYIFKLALKNLQRKRFGLMILLKTILIGI